MNENLFDLTSSEKSIWLTEQYFENTNTNNLCATLLINEIIDFNIMNKAINIVIQENDIFRLRFLEKDGVSKQYFETKIDTENFEILELENQKTLSNFEQILSKENFNLNEKLYTIKMFKLKNSKKSGCIITIHHIISDAFSMGLLCQKTMDIYCKLLENAPIEHNEKYNYLNYINSEKEYINSTKFENDKNYWMEKFETMPNIISIPATKKEPKQFSSKAHRYLYTLEKEKLEKITEFCSKYKISIFNFFMGALALYVYRVNDTNDFVIGTPILNRTNFNEKNTLGMFINIAPLRINLDENSTILELLSNIATDTMGLLRHQKYSYQYILEELRKTNPSIPNLYNIVLSYQITKTNLDNKISYQTNWTFNGNSTSDLDIQLYDVNNTGKLNISYDYRTSKYSREDIYNINQRLQYIIEQILNNPNISLTNIDIVTPNEKNTILNIFNNTKLDYDPNISIIKQFENQVLLTPNAKALTFKDTTLTYKELNEKANQLAHKLISLNIKNNSIVAILMERSAEIIVSILAILKAGGAYLPIDPDYPSNRIMQILTESQASLILYKNKAPTYNYIPTFQVNLNTNDIFQNSNLPNPNISSNPSDLSYIIYTSGSTGTPKGVMLTQKNYSNFLASMQNKIEYLNDKKQHSIISITTISFDIFGFETIVSLCCGLHLYFTDYYEQKQTEILEKYVYENNIDIIQTTPSVFYHHIKKLKNSNHFANLKYIILAGEPLTTKITNAIFNINPNCTIYNGYGPSETTIFSAISKVEKNKKIVIGTPINNTQIYILDNNGKVLPTNTVGEIYISGDGVGNGYLNRPDLTNPVFVNNPFHKGKMYKTGDLGYWQNDGTIICNGRKDTQIKLNGLRIELSEIEQKINMFLNSNSRTCVLLQSISKNNILHAYIESTNPIDIDELKIFLLQALPNYMMPKYFTILTKFPQTPNGKINKKELLKLVPKNTYEKGQLPKNLTSTEKIILEIISNYTSIKKINITDDFFSLGLDSLKIIDIAIALNQKFKTNLSISDIYNHLNIKKLALYIDSYNISSNIKNINDFEKYSSIYPVSSAQKRIYFASTLSTNQLPTYNISGAIEFLEKLNLPKIEYCLKKLLERHDSFKTYFEIIDGELFQKLASDITPTITYFNNVKLDEIENYFEKFNTNFDLSRPPLLKGEVLFLENNHTILFISMHHIISDGTSLQILLKEFCQLYNNESLEPIRFKYKDFINYEKFFSKSDDYEKNKNFWLKEFSNEIQTLNLPTTYSRPAVFTFNGLTIQKELDSNIRNQIINSSKKLQVTPYMFMLSVYYILLYKYTSQEEIIIGTPTANREIAEFSDIIGMFVNTLAIRKSINSDLTFRDFLTEVKVKCLNCFKHQNYPFDELVKELNLTRDVSRNPIFDTMFIYQNNGLVSPELSKVNAKYYFPKNHISKFDLSLEVIPQEDNFLLNFEYCTDLFSNEFINEFAIHYTQLLKNILNNLNTKVSDLEILTTQEKNKILYDFNDTRLNFKLDKIINIFKDKVAKYPNNIAVEYNDNTITYLELEKYSDILAYNLQQQGIKKGNIIGVYLNKSIELIISIFAILKLDAIYMPMQTEYPTERLEYMLENSNSNLIITKSKYANNIAKPINKIILDNYLTLSDNNIKFNYIDDHNNNIIYTLYTSGSTGNPKGVLIKNNNLVNHIYTFNYYYKNTTSSKDAFLSSTNISFDVSIWELFYPLLNGAKLVLYNEETIHDIINYTNHIINKKITGAYIPPNILNEVYSLLQNKEIYLNKLLVGVESIKKSTLNNYFNLNPNMMIINGYGPTETTICSTALNYKKDTTTDDFVSIGKPLCNNNIYILDKNMNPQPIGVLGEIYISGIGVGAGYLNNLEENNKRFIINQFDKTSQYMYKTGDLGKWNNNGTIEYIGRSDFQVKISGHRIEILEIENKIYQFPNIKKCLVLPQSDNNNRKYLIAYLTIKDKISINKLKEHLRSYLPKYMIPSYFEILDDFPYTPNGKIDKKKLPIPTSQYVTHQHTPARNELDKKILEIFEKLLNISPIGITDNFFELGGDSLLAINLQIELMKFTDNISYADIFLNPTVQELTNKINNENIITESLSSTIELLNYNSYIQNYTTLPHSLEKQNVNNILLAGATGFLGIHVLSEFIENENGKIYCLLRPEKGLSLQEKLLVALHFYFDTKYDNLINNRIIIINGDITLPNLGLSPEDYLKIKDNFSSIINCAAKVSHFGKYELYKKINVDGVQNIINFCKENNKKFFHISTLSVSGEDILPPDSEELNIYNGNFKENDLFINQKIDNVYVKSKFEAEKLIISELQNGLDGYIFRVGNLMGRYSDGKFQRNIEENAYINRLISFIKLKAVPEQLIGHSLEFTPIDLCANAIIKLIQYSNPNNRIFHLLNSNYISINEILNIFEKEYFKLNIIPNNTFQEIVNELLKSNKTSYLNGIIKDFNKQQKLDYIQKIAISSKFTETYLQKINFIWPNVSDNYIIKFLNYLYKLYNF